MENKKLTPEDLEQVTRFAQNYQQTIYEIGVIEQTVNKLNEEIKKLNNEKQQLFNDLIILETKENELSSTLREKYGEGNINPQTGEITPV